jgi:hypothetical protein
MSKPCSRPESFSFFNFRDTSRAISVSSATAHETATKAMLKIAIPTPKRRMSCLPEKVSCTRNACCPNRSPHPPVPPVVRRRVVSGQRKMGDSESLVDTPETKRDTTNHRQPAVCPPRRIHTGYPVPRNRSARAIHAIDSLSDTCFRLRVVLNSRFFFLLILLIFRDRNEIAILGGMNVKWLSRHRRNASPREAGV